MVKTALRLLPLLACAALTGAVGIAPRRESSDDRRDERPSAPAPSAPARSAAPPAPASAPSSPRSRVGIGPRQTAPAPKSQAEPGRSFTPSPSSSESSRTVERHRVGISRRVTEPAPGFSPSSSAGARSFSPSAAAAGRVRIQRREGVETEPLRYYWHGSGDGLYSHYYDGRVHWYGYPYEESFFWMRPYGGLWWTWDARFSRWSYWNDGFWWWPGPGGVQYVFVDNDYYQYDAVRRAPAAAPAATGDGRGAWSSPDGRRLVEIAGPGNEAILYDKSTSTPSYVKYLGKDVSKVRFSAVIQGDFARFGDRRLASGIDSGADVLSMGLSLRFDLPTERRSHVPFVSVGLALNRVARRAFAPGLDTNTEDWEPGVAVAAGTMISLGETLSLGPVGRYRSLGRFGYSLEAGIELAFRLHRAASQERKSP